MIDMTVTLDTAVPQTAGELDAQRAAADHDGVSRR